jgi:hypothetical protein
VPAATTTAVVLSRRALCPSSWKTKLAFPVFDPEERIEVLAPSSPILYSGSETLHHRLGVPSVNDSSEGMCSPERVSLCVHRMQSRLSFL